MIPTVQLPSGASVARGTYLTTSIALDLLMERDLTTVCELADAVAAGDRNAVPPHVLEALADVGLVHGGGIHEDTWAVICAQLAEEAS
jgi:hypothetical protein